jgi:hypothetical protein
MWAWLKKWWWIIVGGLAAGLVLVAKLLPRRSNEHIVDQTKADAARIKDSADLEIEQIDKETEQLEEELDEIMDIKDEKTRLQNLADFACRKKGRT